MTNCSTLGDEDLWVISSATDDGIGSRVRNWLLVGVFSSGVTSVLPSSSDELSSLRLSSCS